MAPGQRTARYLRAAQALPFVPTRPLLAFEPPPCVLEPSNVPSCQHTASLANQHVLRLVFRPDLPLPRKSHREINPAGGLSTEAPTKDRLSRAEHGPGRGTAPCPEGLPPETARVNSGGGCGYLDLIPLWLWVQLGGVCEERGGWDSRVWVLSPAYHYLALSTSRSYTRQRPLLCAGYLQEDCLLVLPGHISETF